jgi:hypothetical protein
MMTTEQKAAFNAIMGMAHRRGMKIAELQQENCAAALKTARRTLLETAAEQRITQPELIEICSKGIEVVLREIGASGNPGVGHA